MAPTTPKKIIDGEGVIAGEKPADDAAPAEESPVVVNPTDNFIITDPPEYPAPEAVFEDYLNALHANMRSCLKDPNIPDDAKNFHLNDLKPYRKYLYFQNNTSSLGVKKIPRTEFLSILKQTSPEYAELVENSDLVDLLSQEIHPLSSIVFSEFPSALRGWMGQEKGLDSLRRVQKYSVCLFQIPHLKFLSLFMDYGAQFRDYLGRLNFPSITEPILTDIRHYNGSSDLKTAFPDASELFAPEKLRQYLQCSGKREIVGFTKEYESVKSNFEVWYGNQRQMHEQLYHRLTRNNAPLVAAN